ncbi:MAG: shikimate dehydrogenase [Parvibaculales bacterium]
MSVKKTGIIGYPVSHSCSPALHGFWHREYGIEASYEAVSVSAEKLGEGVGSLFEKQGFCGVNVTIPHKQAVVGLCDHLSLSAKRLGAVNILTLKKGEIYGDNSDGVGFLAHMQEHVELAKLLARPVILFGAGGAGRAILFALLDAGASCVRLVNRTRKNAEDLYGTLSEKERGRVVLMDALSGEALRGGCLFVNASSLGMENEPPLEVELAPLHGQALVYDIVYRPLMTPLLRAAHEKGLRPLSGLGMLVHQAVPAFEQWFGVKPVVHGELYEMLEKELG